MPKLFEMLTNRDGKLSVSKVSFFLGVNAFLIGWSIAAFSSRTVPEMPNSLALFVGVLSADQFGRSFLTNKSKENKTPPAP